MDYSLLEEIRDKLGAVRPSGPVMAGLAVLCIAVLLMAARLLMPPAAGLSIETSPCGETEEPQPSTVFIHVSGAVGAPGLVELPEGSRVADAIEAAGGFAEGADSASVNLARVVADGEQVAIGSCAAAEDESGAVAGVPATGSGKVRINSATEAELQSLPGVGEATAAKIVADRKANGPFASLEDLMRVSGIGQKKYEALADLIAL